MIPLLLLTLQTSDKINILKKIELIGLSRKNIKKSIIFGILFLPIMLLVTFLVQYYNGFSTSDPDVFWGVISFIESFTEEFFFRGVLFLFLIKKTNFKIAYITSLMSFILAHPQNITDLLILSTIVQGIITLEICRRTRNLIGPWLVHGTNRFFSIVILPFIF
jgi:membrane protease YdiL (CAAX protease family)